MTKTLVTFLLLSFALTACVAVPERGYRDSGYRDNNGGDRNHAELHADQRPQGSWSY